MIAHLVKIKGPTQLQFFKTMGVHSIIEHRHLSAQPMRVLSRSTEHVYGIYSQKKSIFNPHLMVLKHLSASLLINIRISLQFRAIPPLKTTRCYPGEQSEGWRGNVRDTVQPASISGKDLQGVPRCVHCLLLTQVLVPSPSHSGS